MSAFEHVILLLSFIYALALTHLLSTAALLIRARSRVRFSWFWAFWMLNAVVMIIANWMSFWDMRMLARYTVGDLFFVFALAFTNYLYAALVCPHVKDEGPIDLPAFHAEEGLPYMLGALSSVISALLANLIYGGSVSEWNMQNFAVIPMLMGVLLATVVRARWAQIAAPVIVTCTWIFYFGTLQQALR